MRSLINAAFWFSVLLLCAVGMLPIVHLIVSIFVNGVPVILENGYRFFVDVPISFFNEGKGGIGPEILGSLSTVLVATALSFPISLGVAVYLVEWPNSFLSRVVRNAISLLLETPTIIISLVVYTLIVIPTRTFSGFAASVALLIVMLPYTISGIENALKGVPQTYKEAGYSLGLTRAAVLSKITIRIASRGIAAAVTLGFAKAAGETAPLLFTIGALRSAYPTSFFGPMDSLPLLIYDYVLSPYEIANKVAWGASLVLILFFACFFTLFKLITKEVRL